MKKLFAILVAIFLVGCGSSDSIGSTEILGIDFRDQSVADGGVTQVRVSFSAEGHKEGSVPDSDPSFSSDPFGLTVLLPSGSSFVAGSSRLTDSLLGDILFGNPDRRAPDSVGNCGDGNSYVYYSFRSGELGDPSVLDQADLYLKFDINVIKAASGKHVAAGITSSNDPNPCSTTMSESVIINVD